MSQSTIYKRNLERYIKLQQKAAHDERPPYMRVFAGISVLSYLVPSSVEYSGRSEKKNLNEITKVESQLDDTKRRMTSQVVVTNSNNNLPCALLGISAVAMIPSRLSPSLPFLLLHSNPGNQSSAVLRRTHRPRAPRTASLYYIVALAATVASGALRSLRAS